MCGCGIVWREQGRNGEEDDVLLLFDAPYHDALTDSEGSVMNYRKVRNNAYIQD